MNNSGMLQQKLQQNDGVLCPSDIRFVSDWGIPAPVTSTGNVLNHAQIDALIDALLEFRESIPEEEIARYNLNLRYSSVAKFENRFKARAKNPTHPYPDMVLQGYGDWWVGPKRTDFCEELIEGAIAHLKDFEKPHDRIQATNHINNLVKVADWTALELRFERGSEVIEKRKPRSIAPKMVTPIEELTYEDAKDQGRSDEWFTWKQDKWIEIYKTGENRFFAKNERITVSLESRQDFLVWAMNKGLLSDTTKESA